MIVITCGNEKGGCGKSCLGGNLGYKSSISDHKTLIIDMDGQRANISYFYNIKDKESRLTIEDVLCREVPIRKAIVQIRENLFILPANSNVSNLSSNAKISKFKREMASIADEYDYVFIDINPTPGWSHVLALSVSDFVISPVLPDVACLEALKGIKESINEIQDTINPKLKMLGVVFNKLSYENRNLVVQARTVAERMAVSMDTVVFKSKFRDCKDFAESVAFHQSVYEYNPKSPACQDVDAVYEEMMQRIAELKGED